MSKNEIFLSKSVTFAIEMVRACLPHTPTELRLNGMWQQMNMGTQVLGDERCGQRMVALHILIYPGNTLSASCSMDCVNSEWVSGQTEIRLFDESGCYNANTKMWRFACQLARRDDSTLPLSQLNKDRADLLLTRHVERPLAGFQYPCPKYVFHSRIVSSMVFHPRLRKPALTFYI